MSVKDKPSKLMKFSTVPKNQHEINGYNAENQTLLKYEIALHLCSEKKKKTRKKIIMMLLHLKSELQSTQSQNSEK